MGKRLLLTLGLGMLGPSACAPLSAALPPSHMSIDPRTLPPIRDVAGYPAELQDGIPAISRSVVQTPAGTYGVIGMPMIPLEGVMLEGLRRVRVTYLHQNDACGDLHCEVLGVQTLELSAGREAVPGYWGEAGRVVLKLDAAAGTIQQSAQQRYGAALYTTDYFVSLFFQTEVHPELQEYRILLTGWPVPGR